MWTDSAEGRSFITQVSQSVVSEIAPEELVLFDDLLQDYFKNPTPPDLSAKASDEPLGFGLEGVLIALTPAAAAALKAVVDYLLGPTAQGVMKEGSAAIVNKVKQLLNPADKSAPAGEQAKVDHEPTPDSNKERLAVVKKIARAEAKKFGLSDSEADRLAFVIVAKLALS
jgi:ABC-type Fe3+ transport system substrate-binding protein